MRSSCCKVLHYGRALFQTLPSIVCLQGAGVAMVEAEVAPVSRQRSGVQRLHPGTQPATQGGVAREGARADMGLPPQPLLSMVHPPLSMEPLPLGHLPSMAHPLLAYPLNTVLPPLSTGDTSSPRLMKAAPAAQGQCLLSERVI